MPLGPAATAPAAFVLLKVSERLGWAAMTLVDVSRGVGGRTGRQPRASTAVTSGPSCAGRRRGLSLTRDAHLDKNPLGRSDQDIDVHCALARCDGPTAEA